MHTALPDWRAEAVIVGRMLWTPWRSLIVKSLGLRSYRGGGYWRSVLAVVLVLQMWCISFVASSKAFGELAMQFVVCPVLSDTVLGHSSK